MVDTFQVIGIDSLFGLGPRSVGAPPAVPALSGGAEDRAATPSGAKTTSYGPYVLEKVHASGGRSTTFLAHRTGSSLRVTLTVWPVESSAEEEQCLKEFRQLAKLEHPGIAKVHDFGAEKGYLFVATDFLGGSRLSTWLGIKGHRPNWRETARLIADVAETLAYLHAAEIYHGDVKPATIIVTRDESPVLLLPVPSVLRAGIPETPAYIAPEQVEAATFRRQSRLGETPAGTRGGPPTAAATGPRGPPRPGNDLPEGDRQAPPRPLPHRSGPGCGPLGLALAYTCHVSTRHPESSASAPRAGRRLCSWPWWRPPSWRACWRCAPSSSGPGGQRQSRRGSFRRSTGEQRKVDQPVVAEEGGPHGLVYYQPDNRADAAHPVGFAVRAPGWSG